MQCLSDLKVGEVAEILTVDGTAKVKRRLFDLGLTPQTKVKVLAISMLKKSFLIGVRDYALAVQSKTLKLIGVRKL